MRNLKIFSVATFWTLLLAIPLTALAIVAVAYITENLTVIATGISTAIVEFGRSATVSDRGWIMQGAERWPEVAGMIVGMVAILSILLLVRKSSNAENPDE